MRFLEIKKKSGGIRTVCCPDPQMKRRLQSLIGILDRKSRLLDQDNVIQGFSWGKSPVTNAQAHVGCKFTVNFDLKDFFDTVRIHHVRGKMTSDEIEICFVDSGDGIPRPLQGLPTSPAVANIAASKLDKAILKKIKKEKRQIVYTRYADDLSFSCDDRDDVQWLRKQIPQIVSKCGFEINPKKTHVQSSVYGLRNVTGIRVGDQGIQPSRRTKRKMRAAKHQGSTDQLSGLEEWCKLKEPKVARMSDIELEAEEKSRNDLELANNLLKFWRLGRLKNLPKRLPDIKEGNFLLTKDPAYLIGASTYTTGWRSCLKQPTAETKGGEKRRSVKFWLNLEGTYVACELSDKTKTFAGARRRTMVSRVLVHKFRDGTMGYDRFYGHETRRLKNWLEEMGAVPVSKIKHGTKVIGHVNPECGSCSHMDNLVKSKVRLRNGKRVFVAKAK